MNSDSNADILLAFNAGVEPHRVAVAVAAAPVSAMVADSEARSEVDFLSVLKLRNMFQGVLAIRSAIFVQCLSDSDNMTLFRIGKNVINGFPY